MEFVLFLLAIVSLVALAGIIYPFKPFTGRKDAAMSFFGAFVLIGFLAPSESADPSGEARAAEAPKVIAQAASAPAAPAGQEGAAAAETETETETSALAEAEAAAKAEAEKAARMAARAQKNRLRRQERLQKIARDKVQIMQWDQAMELGYRPLKAEGLATEEFTAEIEDMALRMIRPLPAAERQANLDGYEFLAALRPENAEYAAKAEHYRNAIKSDREQVLRTLRKKVDKVEGITWYQHPNAPKYLNSRSTVYLYIGRKGEFGKPWLRMKVQYAASDWLFVNSVTAWHDGIKEPLVSGPFQRDNNTTIWEWVDVAPTGYQLEVLRSLADAREAILRFEGMQYHRDVTLSARDKKAIRDMLTAFEAMGG